MRTFTAVSALAAIAAVVSAAAVRTSTSPDYVKYGDYKTYNLRTKTEKFEKCAGAPGYPYVHYAPCPAGYMCGKKDTYESYEWGMYCIPIPTDYTPKCYDDKARCMGAENKPYVQYHPCCKKTSVCMEMPTWGWGSFCVPKGDDYKAPVTYKKEAQIATVVDTKKFDFGFGSCHATGARCTGATGYPYVDYLDGCCSKDDACIVGKEYGPWGGYCVKSTAVVKGGDAYDYPKVVSSVDSFGHRFWGKTLVWEETCINTGYFGCRVEASNDAYYRGVTDNTGLSCCKDSDVCYRGYCKPKTFIPGGSTGGKLTTMPPTTSEVITFPEMSPPAV